MKLLKQVARTKHELHQFVLILPLAIVLCGCASSGPRYSDVKSAAAFNQPTDKGLVFVYSHDLPLGKKFNVWANERLVSSTMGYGKFFSFQAEPGELHIASQGGFTVSSVPLYYLTAEMKKLERVAFTVEAGKTYYVDMHNGFAREKMVLASKEVGEKKIQTCKWAAPPETQAK